MLDDRSSIVGIELSLRLINISVAGFNFLFFGCCDGPAPARATQLHKVVINRLAGKLEEATDLLNAMIERMLLNRQQAMAEGGDTTSGQKAMLARAYAVLALCTTHEDTRAAAKVYGWGVYCCDFLLFPITSYCS